MENDAATKKLLIKMAEATLRQRFLQFTRKYDHKLVGRTWAEIAKGGGVKLHLSRRHWETPMKIVDALDSLEAYCDSIEAVIREQAERKKRKRSI